MMSISANCVCDSGRMNLLSGFRIAVEYFQSIWDNKKLREFGAWNSPDLPKQEARRMDPVVLPEGDPLRPAADSFVSRLRRGDRPTLAEYTARFPDQANRIRELFPKLL